MSDFRSFAIDKTRVGPFSRLPGYIITVLLLLLAATVIIPMLMPFMFVFKTQLEFSYHPWNWPKQLLWINFTEAWKAVHIGQAMVNTLIVCLGSIVCTVPASAMAAYVFTRYRSRATEIVFYCILIGYFVPIQMVLIPLFKMTIAMKISDSLPGVFLPMAAFGIPFWTIIYRSFYRSLPEELAEAARMDGASHSMVFFRIMFPLAMPATVLAVILTFIGAWNDYLLSLIILSKQDLFTMQLRISQFLNQYGTDRMPRYAAALLIGAAPTVIMYTIGHRWIIRGTLAGALKG
jgi:ABC-type glycerol-3-phosphate transport system permease component